MTDFNSAFSNEAKYDFVPPTANEADTNYSYLQPQIISREHPLGINPFVYFQANRHEILVDQTLSAEEIVLQVQYDTDRMLGNRDIKSMLGWVREEIARRDKVTDGMSKIEIIEAIWNVTIMDDLPPRMVPELSADELDRLSAIDDIGQLRADWTALSPTDRKNLASVPAAITYNASQEGES